MFESTLVILYTNVVMFYLFHFILYFYRCIYAIAGTATTDSVLIMRQLQDKEQVFDFFLKFLNDMEIFDKVRYAL